jgi:predicted metal-dependent hydrolase
LNWKSLLNFKTVDSIEGDGFVAELRRTDRRKTASIKITEGKVVVIVPKSLSIKEINDLVVEKQNWIKQKLAIHKDTPKAISKKFVAGESFSYLGKNYSLIIEPGPQSTCKIHQDNFIVSVNNLKVDSTSEIKQLLRKWYQQQAEIILLEKTEKYAEIIDVRPSKITIKTFKSRWGSCSIHGNIQYNWKIIMAPECIINYLIVHELCHILHHNHSPLFWKTVAKYHPSFKESKAWLKTNANLLDLT